MHNRWLILAVLFLARTTMGFQFQSVATLSDFLVAQLSITYTQLGLLIGCYQLPGIVVAYPGGMLGERWGDKQIAILGLTLMVGLVNGVSVSYASFFGGGLIAGIGAVLLNVLLTKMATDWFAGREIGTALALLVSSWPIGIGIALIVLPAIAITFSVPTAFVSTAVATVLVLVLVAAIYRPPAKPAMVPETGSSFRLSWRETGLVSLAGAVWGLFNVGCIIVLSFTPSLLSARGISARDAGIATSFASWTLISTMVFGGILLDRIGYATALMTTSFTVLS